MIKQEDENSEKVQSEQIDWHTAFFEGLQAEFESYKDLLEFISEVPLTTEPLRIDVVVIKKRSDILIEKNIGQIFRKVNIVEYKSETDYFSVADLHKTIAYVHLYMSLNSTSTEPITEQNTTLSIVLYKNPREVIKYIKLNYGWEFDKKFEGVYYVTGSNFRIQIINCKELMNDENLWLHGLRRDVETETWQKILLASEHNDKLLAYANAFLKANLKKIREETGKMDTPTTFPEAIYMLYRDAVLAGRENICAPIKKDVLQGYTTDSQSLDYAQKKTGLPADEIARVLQALIESTGQ
jgi:hypothetical protein